MKRLLILCALISTIGSMYAQAPRRAESPQTGVYEIEQVVVTNRKYRLARLGHSSGGTGLAQGGWGENGPEDSLAVNIEAGVPIKIERDSDIMSFGMFIRQNGYERALFRLSLYSMNGDTPGEAIVRKDIRFEVKDHQKGRFEVDLTPYGIRFEGGQEILVAMTLLEDEMGTDTRKQFLLSAAALGHGVYTRDTGDWTWERTGGVTITMYLNARVYKD